DMSGKYSLRVYDRDGSWQEVAREPYGDRSYSAAFAAKGRLATTSLDGTLRLSRWADPLVSHDGRQRDPHPVPAGRPPELGRLDPRGVLQGYDNPTAASRKRRQHIGKQPAGSGFHLLNRIGISLVPIRHKLDMPRHHEDLRRDRSWTAAG